MSTTYEEFIARKSQLGSASGFEPIWMPSCLKPFQSYLTDLAIRLGRMGIFAGCGLGKSLMELVFAENVLRYTNKPALIATPLAVTGQFVREGDKFGIECHRVKEGKYYRGINVTNYQQLHHYSPDDFGCFIGDEAGCIKDFDSKCRNEVTEFCRKLPYRLLATATPSPNDYYELGTSSEALGYLGYTDMITRFFKEETKKDYLGWGRKTYRFRGHAEQPFWRWVCSWARACRMPSDLGFSDEGYVLPPLIEREHMVENTSVRPGMLFPVPAKDLKEQREERRITLKERCEAVADIATRTEDATVIWCHLNDEGDLLEQVVPQAVQVSGSMRDEVKEERMLAFQEGQIKRLIIKPKIGAWGMNWQHCHNIVSFPSNSFEQYHQLIHRCYRYGQEHPVISTLVTTEGEQRVLANLQRKARQMDVMFSSLISNMNDCLRVDDALKFDKAESLPAWLAS